MPREILEFHEVKQYLTGVSLIRSEHEGAHSESLYAIFKPNPKQVCDHNGCENPGRFMMVIKDHFGQWFVSISCDQHSPQMYFDLELGHGE